MTAWTPIELSELWAWWDPTDNSSISAAGSFIVEITDQSASGHKLEAAGAVQLTTSEFNGEQAIQQANSASNYLYYDDSLDIQDVVEVYSVHDSTGDAAYIFAQGHLTSRLMGIVQSTGSAPDTNAGTPTYRADGETISPDTRQGLYDALQGGEHLISAHGLDLSNWNDWKPFYYSGGGGFQFSGPFGDLILLDATPSTADRQRIEGYLAHKWGLEGNLDAGHPYKSAAPTLDTDVAVSSASLTLTPNAADVNAAAEVEAAPVELTLTPNPVDVNASTSIDVASAELTLAPQLVDVNASTQVDVLPAALTLTPTSVDVNAEVAVDVAAAALSLTPQSVDVNAETGVAVGSAPLTLTPNAVTVDVSEDTDVAVSSAALALAPQSVDVNAAVEVEPAAVDLALTPSPVDVSLSVTVDVQSVALALTSHPVSVESTENTNVAVLAEVLTLTPNPVTVQATGLLIPAKDPLRMVTGPVSAAATDTTRQAATNDTTRQARTG